MTPSQWRFDFVKYYHPESPEHRLYCEILSTYFQDIDLHSFRKRLTPEEKRLRELQKIRTSSVLPMSISKIKHNSNNEYTKAYCDMLSFNHSVFIDMINKYMSFRLGYDLTEF